MKLSSIEKKHVVKGAAYIDHYGIPKKYLGKDYWVEVNGREYPFNYLTHMAYQMVPGQKGVWLDFQSSPSTRGYIESLGFKVIYRQEGIGFINSGELELFKDLAGTQYRKANDEHVRFGELLRPLALKMNKWAELSLVEDMEYHEDTNWQRSGYFRSYLWIRIMRPNTTKQVYFLIGCSAKGQLFMELDCQRSQYGTSKFAHLPEDKAIKFDDYISRSGYVPVLIEPEQLSSYDWSRLVEETQGFLEQYLPLYDELNDLITEGVKNKNRASGLLQTASPAKTKSYAKRKRSFKGRKVDWDKKLQGSRTLGNQGEYLVIRHEQEGLRSAGFPDLAERVSKVLDGRGFDILSFDHKGNEKHIEVKTTTADRDEPFYMSLNEVEYFEQNDNAILYRLYYYDHFQPSAKFYIMNAKELLSSCFSPLSFEISISTPNES